MNRSRRSLPGDGFERALFLTGRRSGKSRVAGVIAAFEAALAGHEQLLAKGETGYVAVVSPTKAQSTIVRNYIRAAFEQTPMLRQFVESETNTGFTLKNGVRIEVLAGDWRTIRGFTLLAAIVDEACFFGYDAESKVKSDTELIRALEPGLATVNGKLIAISSPYAKKGWCYKQWKAHRNQHGRVMVWCCPSLTMNPLLDESLVERAMAEDRASARSEYFAEWREDVAEFLPRDVIEQRVVHGRVELRYDRQKHYSGFADLSGGRGDDAALAIAHKENRTVVVDLVRRWKPPFNPYEVVREMADLCEEYELKKVTGDNYAAEFVATAFKSEGLRYDKCEKPKSELYRELLARLCSDEIELPDDELLVDQLAGLERRTKSGGRDIIDHSAGGHDDLANAVAGVAFIASQRRRFAGAVRTRRAYSLDLLER